MAIEDLEGVTKRKTEEESYDVDKVEYRRGFKLVLRFQTPQEENIMELETFLSNYMDEYISQRKNLTKDNCIKAVKNAMESIREDYPDADFDDAEIYERTKVRKVNKN